MRNSSLFLKPANIFSMACWFSCFDKALIGQGFQSHGIFAFVDALLTALGMSVTSFFTVPHPAWTSRFQSWVRRTAHLWLLWHIGLCTPVSFSWDIPDKNPVSGLKDFLYSWPLPSHWEPVLLPMTISKNVLTSSQLSLRQMCHASPVSCSRCCLYPQTHPLSPQRGC